MNISSNSFAVFGSVIYSSKDSSPVPVKCPNIPMAKSDPIRMINNSTIYFGFNHNHLEHVKFLFLRKQSTQLNLQIRRQSNQRQE